MRNAHTPTYMPFARDEAALRTVAEAVLAESRGYLIQSRIPAGTPVAEILADASRRAGRITFTEPGIVSPFVRIEGEPAAYVAGLTRKTRQDIGRCRRRLEAAGGATFAAIAEPSDVDAELTRGFAVEGSGWKSQRRTAILDSPETETFYRSVGRRFAALGKLGLSTLESDGRLIAFSMNLVDHGRAWGLKGGYDPAFARYSPGILLTMAEIERCFDLGLEALELLGDEAHWKRKFARDERRHVIVHSYERRPGPFARYLYRRFVRPPARRLGRRIQPGRVRG